MAMTFFAAAEREAGRLLRVATRRRGPALDVLHGAIEWAMVRLIRGAPGITFRLRRGQAAQVRARLLVAACRLGLCDAGMFSGESVGEWLGRGLRDVAHAQVVPLLRAAGRERADRLADLEIRAP